MKKIKIFECFAGIGAQHKALTNLKKLNKLDFEVVGISEWYISAIISYTLIHYNNEFHSFDISNISKQQMIDYLSQPHFSFSNDSKNPIKSLSNLKLETLQNLYKSCVISKNFGSILSIQGKSLPKDIDVLTYSFPCQDLSQAGKQKGMTKDSGTRSGLLWEIKRILEEQKQLNSLPKFLLLENVKAIYNNKNIEDLKIYLEEIKELGYSSYCFALNVKDYGIPQNRERAFVISKLEENPKIEFINKNDNKNYFNQKETSILGKFLNWNDVTNSNSLFKVEEDKCIPNKTKSRYEMLNGKTIDKNGIKKEFKPCPHLQYISKNSQCLTTKQDRSPNAGLVLDNNNFFRFLTPRECFLLMGFQNNDFEYIKNSFNNEHLYKFAGNSIGVNVLELLFENIAKNIKKGN